MVVLRRRRPRPRLRREDVHYLRRSLAAKRRHTHPENTLLLLLHLHFFVFFSSDLLAGRESPPSPRLHVPGISHLLLVPSWSCASQPVAWSTPPRRNDPIAFRATCDPRRGTTERERDYVCWVQGKPLSIYRTSRWQERRSRGREARCRRFRPPIPLAHLTKRAGTRRFDTRLLNRIENVTFLPRWLCSRTHLISLFLLRFFPPFLFILSFSRH